ncbi:RNI-like protein [Hysterangium stoloniferum]|nr:RNI-like protein [Hysterangium stoloniferum]
MASGECSNQTVSENVLCPTSEIVVTEPTNYFDKRLPREIQLAVLKSVVDIHESTLQAAISGNSRDVLWSVATAGRTQWVGREQGLRELVKFSRISKSWQALALDGQLWRNLRLTPSPHLSSALLLRLAGHAGSFVQSLDLRGWTHLEPVALRGLVRSFSFDPASDDPPGALQPTASLTTLSFPPTNLTSVSLRACTALTAHSLHHVLLRAPSLRSVDLHGLTAVTNSTCGVLSAYCPHLENVDLGRCVNLDGYGIRGLIDGVSLARGSYSKVKILKSSGIKGLNAGTFAVLAVGAPALEVLDISCSQDLTDDAISAFVAWDKSWEIPLANNSSDEEPLLHPRKVELTAREMGLDPTIDNGPFYKRITHLRHLNLSSCPLLTDQACTHLAHCVPHLEFLELAGIGPDIGDEGLVRLFKTTPYIRRVDLEDASEVTDAVIDALTPKLVTGVTTRRGTPVPPPPQPGHNLQHLVISYGIGITNEALLGLIQACPRLAVLECDNTRISGAVIKSFVNTMRSRGVLCAEIVAVDCRGITEALVKDLAAGGQIRPRKGYRHYDARTLGYVDARDDEDFNNLSTASGRNTIIDDCDDTKVTLKSFWSWQAVDMVQHAREKRRIASSRRNTDFGIPGSRQPGAFFQDNGGGPSVRPRWLGQWVTGSGTYPSSSATQASLNQDERGCILM